DLAVLTRRPFVYGSVFRFEGQVSVFDARQGACYRCLFQQPPPPDSAPSCAEGGVFGVLPGTIGTLQATEVLKLILGIGEPLYDRLLLYDALDLTLQTVNLKKNPACPICGEQPTIQDLIDYDDFCGTTEHQKLEAQSQMAEISPADLARQLAGVDAPILIDVREAVESQVSQIAQARNIPIEHLLHALSDVERDMPLVLFCRTGVRSRRAERLLKSAGFTNVRSLQGGINAWVTQMQTGEYEY
ncbi:MAG: molybdenum cofactor biosynthesis protein MoeB, partial [Anaerolineae bacterium]|nr:molybdenum cofactor biosynthesis protein MoeB [Anaerolineae bacterium]